MTTATDGNLDDEIPTPSRALMLALLGGIILTIVVLLVVLITPKDSPGLTGTHDSLEQQVMDTYNVENVFYNSPATSTMTVTVDGKEILCTAPTDDEMQAKYPLVCADGALITAK